ncbi:MAG: aminoacyl-tRNA hydrolase [Gemmatimonadota bacterium]
MKVVCGLGNPGRQYELTRHNVGWWVVDEAQEAWRFGEFRRRGAAWVSEGRIGSEDVLLVEPLTFMNRSGDVLQSLVDVAGFDTARDLLIIVDDVALDVGRIRLRSEGSSGGHNGLRSVEAALGTQRYARLRIGVGAPPPGADLAGWVLSMFDEADEQRVVELLADLVAAVRVWVEDGVEAAAGRCNR